MAKRNNRMLITSTTAVVASLILLAPTAFADDLNDKKLQLEQQITEDTASLEFLNSDIIEIENKLKEYQSQLPGLQEEYSKAAAQVSRSEEVIQELNNRISAAENSRFEIEQEIINNAKKVQKIEDDMGKIANDMYRNGGVSSSTLELLLDSKDMTNIGDKMYYAEAVNKNNNTIITSYKERESIASNAQMRLVAVGESISEMREEQERVLQGQIEVREEREKRKNDLDEVTKQAETLSAQLMSKKPIIQENLKRADNERNGIIKEIAIKQERELREAREKEAREAAAREAARQAEIARIKAQEAKEEAVRQAAYKKAEAAKQAAYKKAEAERKAEAEANKKPYVPKPTPKPTPKPKPKPPTTLPPITNPPSSSGGHKGFELIRPVSGGYISSGYGWRPTPPGTIDYGGQGGYVHAGMDFAVGCGTPIKAAAAGTIWNAGWGGGAGNYVMMSHGVSKGNALVTRYHHMTRVAVSAGTKVRQGQIIGYVGSTGNSTGCHLHLETILNGARTNPAPWY